MNEHFGEHFMLDGYGGDEALLDSHDLVLKSLNDISTMLNMKQLAPPQVYHAEANDKKDPGGWTGVLVIMESHISIHTFPKRGFVSIDAYTCNSGLDTDMILKYFTDTFKLQDTETNFVLRGTRYPQENIY